MIAADSVFLFFCTLLVFIMTPGLAFFYGGMVKSKNVLSTTMHSWATMAIVSITWILIGYSLAFGGSVNGLIGNLDFALLKGVGFEPNPDYSATVPHSLFMMFQMMFAILTPALISGSYAERFRFPAFVLFTVLWTLLVYSPIAHWVWGGGGWIRELGALDFAGGNVVHISSGVAGLTIALIIGKRKDYNPTAPHHLPLTVLGAGLLWFGWFGFNVGSALTLDGIAMNAFITTNTATAAAALAWAAAEWIIIKKVTVLGVVSGAVSGLVSITPGAGFVSPFAAIIIGLLGGFICFFAVFYLKKWLGYDDALDAFGCHGIGGTWGGIATGLFASSSINGNGADGLFSGGGFTLLGKQLIAIGVTYAFVGVATFVIIRIISLFMKVRAEEEEEQVGLDLSHHGEKAYQEAGF